MMSSSAIPGMFPPIKYNGNLSISSNGVIDAVKLKLSHAANASINLTEFSLISRMKTDNNVTTIIIVAPETEAILNIDGDFEILEIIAVNSSGEVELSNPSRFVISSAYPNPFNPTTKLNFSIPEKGYLEINIFDINGALIESLVKKDFSAGEYSIDWNASSYSSGVYIANYKFGLKVKSQKLMLIK